MEAMRNLEAIQVNGEQMEKADESLATFNTTHN